MTQRPYKKLTPPSQGEVERDAINHNHLFVTMADVADEHQHLLTGSTSPAIQRQSSHVHRISLLTSYDPKGGSAAHWHQVEVMTGAAFDTPDGGHTHYFAGNTSQNLGHCHSFHSVTDTSPDNTSCEEEPGHQYSGNKFKR